ncbi:interleukin-6 receptor subunit alpha isoform X1 [Larimichthys crocea]|uniref:interleukin-6 receptor subunit alpha isoform X1 n=1 Tax=Larimichthys crocea TaxID=215358 RepID=UPI000F5FAC83|nr:interleukin-6 receptor subunit alpha isoform X1 [Larimichthys crocea]
MRIFLPLLCFLCASPVRSILEGTCLRKEPPPGTVVLSIGSKLLLTCSGDVTVDGVKVRNSSNTNRTASSSSATPATVTIISHTEVSIKNDKHTVENAVSERYHSTEAGENRSLRPTDTGHTASPTTHTVQPAGVHRLLKEELDGEEEEEEEEEEREEGSRVTRGIKSRYQWNRDGKTVGKGDKDFEGITSERRGATLSLSSVQLTDSGEYTCYHRDRRRFSLKVIVAGPPETPSLSCYKSSPSSKIRCEWTPKKPITRRPTCYLLLNKRPTETFLRSQCSYSSQASRCWCALDYNEDELRTVHSAFLCVTSIEGNATSPLLDFTPLSILKPNPPTQVSVQPIKGQVTRLKVTWGFPNSWKIHDRHYGLMYELKYRPVKSSYHYEQVVTIKMSHSYIITDAMPGVEYLVQLKSKDEYDGLWGAWSTPAYGSTWIAPTTIEPTTMLTDYTEESSGQEETETVVEPVPHKVPHHILWISGSFALLSVILAVYIFRHKDRFMSKLQSLSVFTQCGDSPQPVPSAPTAPEGQALVTFGRPRYKEPQTIDVEKEEEENEEQQCETERTDGMHFNNTSYFFLPQ